MNLRTTSLLCLGSLLANLAFLALPGVAQEEEPPVALTPKAVAPEPEASESETSDPAGQEELEVPTEEGPSGLYSAEALTSFVDSLGSGAKLHLAEDGYAEVELTDEATKARAALIITDLLGDVEKLESYETSRITIAGYPATTASNIGNETDVLAAGRFQIELRGESTQFNEAMRIDWLEKHRDALDDLGDGSDLLGWLVPVVAILGALLLLGLFWVSRGSSAPPKAASAK